MKQGTVTNFFIVLSQFHLRVVSVVLEYKMFPRKTSQRGMGIRLWKLVPAKKTPPKNMKNFLKNESKFWLTESDSENLSQMFDVVYHNFSLLSHNSDLAYHNSDLQSYTFDIQ